MIPPEHFLGGDLVWWRASQGQATRVCFYWSESLPFGDRVRVHACLYDLRGKLAAHWTEPMAGGHVTLIDSASDGPWRAAGDIEGVLALFACTDSEPTRQARQHFRRLYPFVDWEGADGRIASLHSDQVMLAQPRLDVQRITEIVVRETRTERNALLILNGPHAQDAGSLALTFRNARGEACAATFDAPMAPFSVNRIDFGILLPQLAELADGQPLVVTGSFRSRGLFTRPYVLTTGEVEGAYHAGDVYDWPSLPRFAHDLIQGEVNPMAVICDGRVQTCVHVLHSHGHFDDDVPIDVLLFDSDGRRVAQRSRWTTAKRHGVASFDVAELLPAPADFRGHIALSFAPGAAAAVPRRLQALLEYRAAGSVARVMAWSDEWNSLVRVAKRRLRHEQPRSFCRVLARAGAWTEIAVTNAGHEGHSATAEVEFALYGPTGIVASARREIAPWATLWARTEELFPDFARLLPQGFGCLVAKSPSDLACVMFTRQVTGAVAAEHFLAIPEVGPDGHWINVAGQ